MDSDIKLIYLHILALSLIPCEMLDNDAIILTLDLGICKNGAVVKTKQDDRHNANERLAHLIFHSFVQQTSMSH
jgi:hypothetical protein